MINRKVKDAILQTLIYLSTAVTVGIVLIIIGFILYKGLPGININFLTRMWDDKTTFVKVEPLEEQKDKEAEGYIGSLGITVAIDENKNVYISKIDSKSSVKNAKDMKKNLYALVEQDQITKVGATKLEGLTFSEVVKSFDQDSSAIRLKVTRPGGGIVPMLVSTIYIIILSLLVAAPIGVLSAIYLNEYAKRGRVLRLIRFAIQNLAGIPSIIYGLFGMLVFVQLLHMQYSILAGALTLSIILLPTIITTTEEALKAIPKSYRESSLGLGATKLQTNYKVVLPNALPGILVAIILSVGRIVGESAALILTAGTIAQIPGSLTGSSAGAATLTTKLYWLIKEKGDIAGACSIAIVLLALIIVINLAAKIISRRFLQIKAK